MTPFEGDGVWLRCALHAHTTNSDGEMAPDMLVRHYESAGYDVLAITHCSPVMSVTLHAGRCRGARANTGRLGYPRGSRVLERDADGLITMCRFDRPPAAPYGRVELADCSDRRAWTNPLWTA